MRVLLRVSEENKWEKNLNQKKNKWEEKKIELINIWYIE